MRALRTASAAAAVREFGRVAGRGLIQVLAGPDPAPAWRSRSRRRAASALAAAGVALLVLAALGAVLTLHRAGTPTVQGFRQARGYPPFLPLLPVLVAPLPLAVRYPLLGWRLAYLTALLAPLIPGQSKWDPGQIAVLLVVFGAAGLRHPRPVLWWMWALMLVPAWLWTGPDWTKPVGVTILFTAAAVVVDAIGAWRRARRALAAEAERAEQEQARRAVLEERTRIARELHDVVAHHLSLIAVQAETAPYRLSDLPEPVRAEFSSLSGAAREALVEMRKLLGVLRRDQPAEHAPQPRLADLPELVAAARRAGGAVKLSMPAQSARPAASSVPAASAASAVSAAPSVPRPDLRVPPGVGVCAYRIVQEALSNAGRHAAGAAVTVTVDQDADAVRLRVTNGPGAGSARNGHEPGRGPGHGPGHGLAGMRERVALLGGSLTAGPAPDSGFTVSAVLPLGDGT